MNFSKIIIVGFVFSIFALSGCEDSGTEPNRNGYQLSDFGFTFDEKFGRYNQENLIGVITLDQYKYNSFSTLNGAPEPNDEVNYYANASFKNEYNKHISVGAISINGAQLSELGPGTYRAPDAFNFNFNGEKNLFSVEANTLIPALTGDVTFSEPVTITNLTRGQNISRSQFLTVNWSGSTSDVAEVIIRSKDIENDTRTEYSGIGGNFDNTGSAVLGLRPLLIKKGLADVTVRRFEPKFVTASNGKKVCIMGISQNIVTVNITD
ncbi:MAG: hypothetical protein V4642_08255 [Bacteroidota bacterium]